MELLHSCSFVKGSNYFLNHFRSFRIYNANSFPVGNRITVSNSCQLFGRVKMFTVLKNEDPTVFYVRDFSNNRFYEKIKKYSTLFKRSSERTSLALHLYGSIDSINFKEFYAFLEMTDTFNSWFVLMELHIWMLLSQLMDKEGHGFKLRNKVVELFWYDVEARINSLKLNTPKILKKQLSELSGRFPIGLMVYDEGLLSTDFVLAGAIWYKFFDKKNVDPRKLEVLVKYVRYQIQHLSLLNLKDYTEVQNITNIWLPVTPYINAGMSED